MKTITIQEYLALPYSERPQVRYGGELVTAVTCELSGTYAIELETHGYGRLLAETVLQQTDDFLLWDRLQFYELNGFRPKKLENELIKEAKKYVPYPFYWQGGTCICDAPYGRYIWHFAVDMKQQKEWNFPEFQQGYKYGRTAVEPRRDDNPYKMERSRRNSWDCGYIWGTFERRNR
jgi:hypothetical protein